MGTFALFSARSAGARCTVAGEHDQGSRSCFFLTLLVTLPSLYVFNAPVGSRLTVAAVVRLLVASPRGDRGGAGFAWAPSLRFSR